ncbi:MAG: putative lipoprotein, partial [Parcubacteria group bacterium Gr01-1014_66]
IKITLFIGFLVVIIAQNAAAQTISTSSDLRAQLEQQLERLRQQLLTLQQQQAAVKTTRSEIKETVQLTRQMRHGMNGEDIKQLQKALAEDSDVYPEKLITGFFGRATENAVRKFQKKHGINAVGEVGPQTRIRLNQILSQKQMRQLDDEAPLSSLKRKPAFPQTSPDAATSSPNSSATTTPSSDSEAIICHIPPGNPSRRHTLTIGAPALSAHLAHGDTKGPCPETTPPPPPNASDTTPPIISDLVATSTTASSSQITWYTNEPATAKVWYATTPIIPAAPTLMIGNPDLVQTHNILLSGLTSSTTYFYIVVSTDVAGNNATSTENNFSTRAQ